MSIPFRSPGRLTRERIPLGDALRIYRKHLVPDFLLPTLILCVMSVTQQPWVFFVIFAPLFYGCGFYAALPYLRKDAPHTFLIVACGLWMLGWIPAFLVALALHALFHLG
jgi:hypothetical protein